MTFLGFEGKVLVSRRNKVVNKELIGFDKDLRQNPLIWVFGYF